MFTSVNIKVSSSFSVITLFSWIGHAVTSVKFMGMRDLRLLPGLSSSRMIVRRKGSFRGPFSIKGCNSEFPWALVLIWRVMFRPGWPFSYLWQKPRHESLWTVSGQIRIQKICINTVKIGFCQAFSKTSQSKSSKKLIITQSLISQNQSNILTGMHLCLWPSQLYTFHIPIPLLISL